jgi:ribosomal protein L37E
MIEPDEDDDWWKRGRSPDDDFDDETTIPCPHCGEDVFDNAEQCPACGMWFTADRRPLTGRSSWFVVLGVVVALLAIATWIVWLR